MLDGKLDSLPSHFERFRLRIALSDDLRKGGDKNEETALLLGLEHDIEGLRIIHGGTPRLQAAAAFLEGA
jgi:hypothetical protein